MITRRRVVTATILGVSHGTTSSAGNFVDEMMECKDSLDEAMALDACCSCNIPVLILQWYHIRWMEWLQNQWASATPIMVSAFEVIWDWMILNEPW